MQALPRALAGFAPFRQFILCKLVPSRKIPGKMDKFPVNYLNLDVSSAHDPSIWGTFEDISQRLSQLGDEYRIGFVFTEHDPFFFLDLDSCFDAQGAPSDLAKAMLSMFSGAAVEVSQSQTGLHIFGRGQCPEHSCRDDKMGMEFYTQERFVCLTGLQASGNVDVDFSGVLPGFVSFYMPPREGADLSDWRDEPVAGWAGPEDDDLLLSKALSSRSAASAFGGKATFRQLFEADPEVLSLAYPDSGGTRMFDESSADAALAQHLAFWTGNNHTRIDRLMRRSGLHREKWDEREDYLPRTICRAVSGQRDVYNNNSTRSTAVTTVGGDNPPPTQAVMRTGIQIKDPQQQREHFRDCVYVRDAHRIFEPSGSFLKPEQFNAVYGGFLFWLDADGHKTTKKAWEAFTESQAIAWPKVHSHVFRPELPTGAILSDEGQLLLNTYIPVDTRRVEGDPGPFLDLLQRMVPNDWDRQVLLGYMAAVVQYPGEKFQYCPIVQGVEGNGKSFLMRCLAHAVGHRYTHFPNAQELAKGGGKFTGWMDRKLFIGVEEIKVVGKSDLLNVLKPMISNDRLEIQGKGIDQKMGDNRSNWFMACNNQDDVPVTVDTRRYCVFFTAQQVKQDLVNSGMTGNYFIDLKNWFQKDGYSIVNNYFREYVIPDEVNPTMLARAPETSSMPSAIEVTRPEVENVILEAIESERPGFRPPYVSTIALDRLLEEKRMSRELPLNKRAAALDSLGYVKHPSLTGGRVNNTVMAEGGKPRLYVKNGHPALQLSKPPEIQRHFEETQGYATATDMAAAVTKSAAGNPSGQ